MFRTDAFELAADGYSKYNDRENNEKADKM